MDFVAKWHSQGEASRILTAKGLKTDLDAIGAALDGTDLADLRVKRELEIRHWRTSEKIWKEANYTYDGFRDGVAVEAIGPGTSGERAIVYEFVRMELGRHRADRVEVGVLFVSMRTHLAKSKSWAVRLREAGILLIPIAIVGIDTR